MKKRVLVVVSLALVLLIGLMLWNQTPPSETLPLTYSQSQTAANDKDNPSTDNSNRDSSNDQKQALSKNEGGDTSSAAPVEDTVEEDEEPATLFGKVLLESDNAPVGDAKVFLLPYPRALKPEQGRTESSGDGSFAFKGPLQGAYLIYASKGPYLSYQDWETMEKVVFGPEDTQMGPIKLKLSKGEAIRLKVLSQNGNRPIKGARVLARGQLQLNFYTKEDGTAQVSLAPGVWSLITDAPGYRRHVQALDLSGFQPKEVVVRLHPAGFVQGVVSDGSDQVLEGVKVICLVDNEEFEILTDSEGHYFFDQVPLDKPFTLHFSHKGFHDAYLNWQRFSLGKTEKIVDVRLRRKDNKESDEPESIRTIMGTVTTSDNAPFPGVTVRLGIPSDSELVTAVTNQNGQYSMQISDIYRPTILSIKHPGYSSKPRFLTYGEEDSQIEDFVLTPSFPLNGIVTDPSGRTLKGVAVTIGYYEDNALGGAKPPVRFEEVVYTQADGTFTYADAREGKLDIMAWQYGYAKFFKKVDGRNVQGQQVEVVLEPMGVLKGFIYDDQGKGLEEFKLKLSWASNDFARPGDGLHIDPIWTSEGVQMWSTDGSFRIAGINPGVPLKLSVEAPGFTPQHVLGLQALAEEDAVPVEIVLDDRGIRIAGQLVDEKNRPLAGKAVEVISYDPNDRINSYFSWNLFFRGQHARRTLGHQRMLTDAQGRFEFQGIPDGRIEMLINHPGLALAHIKQAQLGDLERIQLKARPEARITINIDRNAHPTAKRLDITQARNHDFSMPLLLDDLESTYVIRQLPTNTSYTIILTGWVDPINRNELTRQKVVVQPGETVIDL